MVKSPVPRNRGFLCVKKTVVGATLCGRPWVFRENPSPMGEIDVFRRMGRHAGRPLQYELHTPSVSQRPVERAQWRYSTTRVSERIGSRPCRGDRSRGPKDVIHPPDHQNAFPPCGGGTPGTAFPTDASADPIDPEGEGITKKMRAVFGTHFCLITSSREPRSPGCPGSSPAGAWPGRSGRCSRPSCPRPPR